MRLHPLEVKGIANGDIAAGIKGMDPISNGQLTRDEIERCQNDATAELQLADAKRDIPAPKPRKGSRYTPLSKRQERPDAIAWLVRNHPELNDAEIGRLVGTTKPTIQSIRDRSHWNMANITPLDPVTLGMCSQIELDEYVAKAAKREEQRQKRLAREAAKNGEVLKDATETTAVTERRRMRRRWIRRSKPRRKLRSRLMTVRYLPTAQARSRLTMAQTQTCVRKTFLNLSCSAGLCLLAQGLNLLF